MNKDAAVKTWKLARSYLEAASKLSEDKKPTEHNMPAYFLFGHAIELAFKSYLISQGETENDLKKIGHDLEKAMEQAYSYDSFDVHLKENQKEAIRKMNPYYCGKMLEYHSHEEKQFPDKFDFESTAQALVFGVKPLVPDNKLLFQLQLTPAQSDALTEYVNIIASALCSPDRTSPLRLSLVDSIPATGGVYGVYRDNQLIYVGESGCLKERIGEIFKTRKHSLRRTLGEELFGNNPGFERATTKKPFSPEIEANLTKFTEKHLEVLAIPLALGRKEIEEKLVGEIDWLLNKRGQRGI